MAISAVVAGVVTVSEMTGRSAFSTLEVGARSTTLSVIALWRSVGGSSSTGSASVCAGVEESSGFVSAEVFSWITGPGIGRVSITDSGILMAVSGLGPFTLSPGGSDIVSVTVTGTSFLSDSVVSGILGFKLGRMCMDSGGDEDESVLFSAALTGTIMMGTKGVIGEGDDAPPAVTVGDVVSVPVGRAKSLLYFGVGIAVYTQR